MDEIRVVAETHFGDMSAAFIARVVRRQPGGNRRARRVVP
jgi:hypothetical protein